MTRCPLEPTHSRFALALALVLAVPVLLAAGCAADGDGSAVEGGDPAFASGKADWWSIGAARVGTLVQGATVEGRLTAVPIAYELPAQAGDRIDLTIESESDQWPAVRIYPPLPAPASIWDYLMQAPLIEHKDDLGRMELEDFELEAAGTYLVLIWDAFGEAGSHRTTLSCAGGACQCGLILGVYGQDCSEGFWCSLDGDYQFPDDSGRCIPEGRCTDDIDCSLQTLQGLPSSSTDALPSDAATGVECTASVACVANACVSACIGDPSGVAMAPDCQPGEPCEQ